MSCLTTKRALAEGVFKTIQRLDSDPDVDLQSPAYINLKCSLVQRLLRLEVDMAERIAFGATLRTWHERNGVAGNVATTGFDGLFSA
jgi:hypothetical protein